MYFLNCKPKIYNYLFKFNNMKKSNRLVLTALITTALLAGCKDDPVLPTSEFTFDPTEITVYDEVTFTNASTNADSYAWEFGDGAASTEMNPVHIYKASGTYTVKLVASNADGNTEKTEILTVNDPHNYYTINGTEFTIDSEMFWYQAPQGGDPYIRLLTTVSGQDNPDLLKLYPNKGLGDLPNTYTWDSEKPVGTYDAGYTFNYAGMAYDSTALGKTGSGNLVITELDAGVYLFEAEMVLSIGDYDWAGTFEFIETSTADLKLEYIGGITPL
jgi:PKD repeat protein